MAHGGYGKRRVAGRKPMGGSSRRSKGLSVDKKSKPKPKSASLKNQIRSVERMLRKDLPPEVRETQEKKLEELKKQREIHNTLSTERIIFLRGRKIKFFERRKIERRLRRLEKLQRASSGQSQGAEVAGQLLKLKEDLEYVRFFPKTERYVSLFMGGDDTNIIETRNSLREKIKANIAAAAASGKDLEETGSEDDGLLDVSDDDFFLTGSSSDEADADDEWTDKSAREQASSASGKATSGLSSDERNHRQNSARVLMPPPRPSSNSVNGKSNCGGSSSKKPVMHRAELSTSSNTSDSSRSGPSSRNRVSSDVQTGLSSNVSSNSDAKKPRRKRRVKKKKQTK
ncbi:rRNA-processing protein EFG1-like [Impatiens glandulifera]|uniref:rRNA-processing protein EFG1-like n=1 Tax=Impatiens glandulifera TaxID=253017 RepID=UPI001FB1730E|nr:rRNA-processing protein EFG1-like [Impatiens glandulifera]